MFNPSFRSKEYGNDFLAGFGHDKKSYTQKSTLSGLNYVRRIEKWRNQGYEVILFFLKLPSEEMAINRVKLRVAEGGHNVPENIIRRRYRKGWHNFQNHYKKCVDAWVIFDNSGATPTILEALP